MKFRIALAAIFTAVALTACDKAEEAKQVAAEKTKETVAEVSKATESAADKAKQLAEDAKALAAEKAAEVAKAAEEAKAAAAAKAAEMKAATEAKAAELKAAAEAKAAEAAKMAEEAKIAAAAKLVEMEAAAKAKAAEAAKMAEEAKVAAAAKAAEMKAAAEAKAAELKAMAEEKAAEAAKMAEEAKAAAAAKAAEMEAAAKAKAEEAAAKAKAEEAAKMAEEAKVAAAAKAAEMEAAAKAKAEETAKMAEEAKVAAAAKAAEMKTATTETVTEAAKATMIAPTKVGFVYVGPIGDHGWSYQHDQSRQALENALNVKTAYVESVPEGADAERVIRQLAADGNEVIFTTSFGYMNPTNKVAKSFPNVKFEHATGYKRGPNVSTYSARFYEGRAVLGTIAGKMTKTNTIGYIASFPIPEVIRGINAMTLAARKVNPDVKVKVVWVNTWFDPGKEGDAAKALIDQGADIITQHTDSPAPLQVAEKRGVYGFGQASNMKAFAPNAQLTAIVNNWNEYYISRVKAAKGETWTSTDTWDGIKAGMVTMAPYGDAVPADVRATADAVKASIVDGSFHPFQGPIKNQAGEIAVKAGETLDDGALAGMNWYVDGVDGIIPK